jgi:hypothetical protein
LTLTPPNAATTTAKYAPSGLDTHTTNCSNHNCKVCTSWGQNTSILIGAGRIFDTGDFCRRLAGTFVGAFSQKQVVCLKHVLCPGPWWTLHRCHESYARLSSVTTTTTTETKTN